MLCECCTAAFDNPQFSRISSFNIRHKTLHLQVLHPDYPSLEAALKKGCGFCHRLVDAVASKRPSKILSGLQLHPDVEPGSFSMGYRFSFESDSRKLISCVCVFQAKKGGKELKEACTENLFLSPEQVPLPDAPALEAENGIGTASMDVLTSWIDNCRENHPLCRREREPPSDRRFARILDVEDVADATDVKLCLTDRLPADAKYMTLSHCWGTTPLEIPSLTTSNYQEYLQRISIEQLPRTFQDAIRLTRRVGVRYLWIDSLCIIQDSQEDWFGQAAVMGEVYRGSYLNIAATKSENPNGGLFTSRNPALVTPFRVSISAAPLPRNQSDRPIRVILEEPSSLVSFSPTSHVQYTESRLDLNTCLGNRNGDFDPRGENFSQSARHMELIGTTLHAELRTVTGEWKRSSIEAGSVSGIVSKRQKELLSFRLEGSSVLITRFPVQETEYNESRIDLNKVLGNDNGSFTQSGENFASSAKDVRLDGTTLVADLRAINGEWKRSSTDVQDFVERLKKELSVDKNDTTQTNAYYDVGADYYGKWVAQIARAKLCTRGWVVQERLLAPRVVHFGKRQLIWECVQAQALEEKPNMEIDNRQAIARTSRLDFKTWDMFSTDLLQTPAPRELGLNYVWSSVKAMYGSDGTSLRKDDLARNRDVLLQAKRMCYGADNWTPTHPLNKFWSVIITTYSAAQLTYSEDRLIAIAGLARTLSARTGISYAAGLWMHQLPRQLLWNLTNSIRGPKRVEQYVAPSWSWASYVCPVSSRGLKLEPILETKGAMDLIKILSVDLQGVMQDDAMPFGRIKGGRLRLRGRLLPISLDMKVWPDGATRKDELVQFWVGTTPEPPVGETFIVPVLFTRWNERLPAATPNSLLLESTGEKGVFRRIGTARLSSLCPLKAVIPQLYSARSSYYGDDDDDADSEGEARDEDAGLFFTTSSDSRPVEPSPQQELQDVMFTSLAGKDGQGSLGAVVKMLQKTVNTAAHADNPAMSKAKASSAALLSLTNNLVSQFPGQPGQKIRLDPQQMQENLRQNMAEQWPGTRIGVQGRNHMWVRGKEAPKLEPKEAVAGHFYLEYVEDEDAVRFGHFVFEIV